MINRTQQTCCGNRRVALDDRLAVTDVFPSVNQGSLLWFQQTRVSSHLYFASSVHVELMTHSCYPLGLYLTRPSHAKRREALWITTDPDMEVRETKMCSFQDRWPRALSFEDEHTEWPKRGFMAQFCKFSTCVLVLQLLPNFPLTFWSCSYFFYTLGALAATKQTNIL
jgi:hypothetical protein